MSNFIYNSLIQLQQQNQLIGAGGPRQENNNNKGNV